MDNDNELQTVSHPTKVPLLLMTLSFRKGELFIKAEKNLEGREKRENTEHQAFALDLLS